MGTYKGEELPVGSYYYVIEIVMTNGEKKVESGAVTILR